MSEEGSRYREWHNLGLVCPQITEMALLSKITSSSLLLSLSSKPIYNAFLLSRSTATTTTTTKQHQKKKENAKAALAKEKRRTRSDKHFNHDAIIERCNINDTDTDTKSSHIPVMLGEVLDVFSNSTLTSFVDCTLGAAGHSTAVIRGHPELRYFVGMDVDSVAHDIAQPRLDAVLSGDVKAFTVLRNFRDVKSVLREIGELQLGVDGILMDLGMSSMQVDDPARGFSVLGDGPLDMRMDPQACDRQVLKLKTY